MKKRRAQRVFVIQRVADGLFCANVRSPEWVEDVADADFVSQTKFKGIVRAEWGRDLEDYSLCEVAPVLIAAEERGENE